MPFLPYERFVTEITDGINRTREEEVEGENRPKVTKATVKEVLDAFNVGFMELEEGEQVKTPFGVFTLVRQKSRTQALPGSDKIVKVPEQLIVRFNPGKRLRFPG